VCNLYSITTNQEAIRALFRVVNRYVGNLAPMPGVFPDYKAPIVAAAHQAFCPGGRNWSAPRHETASALKWGVR
jgi:putative SOS response-associated peptidase YedK